MQEEQSDKTALLNASKTAATIQTAVKQELEVHKKLKEEGKEDAFHSKFDVETFTAE